MKGKFIFLAFVILTTATIFSFIVLQKTAFSKNNLIVEISQSKSNYLLGEIVPINIKIINQGNSDVYLRGATPQSGYVKILISDDGKIFKEYDNGNWGNKKMKGLTIAPNQTINSQANILANSIFSTSHLNAKSASEIVNKKVMTVYAFPKAGEYYLKAVLVIPNKDGNEEIESESVQITIEEPQGKDLEIWNRIKDRADFAYFIQEGEMVDFRSLNEQTKFEAEIEYILQKYPNSFYAESLRQSLDKFQAAEAKRQETMQKLKQKQPQ